MYTRNYYSEDEKIRVPENYDGIAFPEQNEIKNASETDPKIPSESDNPPLRAPWDIPKEEKQNVTEEVMAKPRESGGILGDFMNKLPFGSLFKKGDFLGNALSDFGTEEILIIGVALFLLLSKNGDKECAFILLFLLFVK